MGEGLQEEVGGDREGEGFLRPELWLPLCPMGWKLPESRAARAGGQALLSGRSGAAPGFRLLGLGTLTLSRAVLSSQSPGWLAA